MHHSQDQDHIRTFIIGGMYGAISVLLYVAAISMPVPDSPTQLQMSFTFLVGTAWPIIGVVYSCALCRLIALERQGLANRFAFLLSLFGLATVTAMISAQMAVHFGVHEFQHSGRGASGCC